MVDTSKTTEESEITVDTEATSDDPSPSASDPPKEDAVAEEDVFMIHNLSILPPRQRTASSVTAGIALPPLRLDEQVASLRGALAEIVDYAQCTQFRLEVEAVSETNGGSAATTKHGTSSTTSDAVVSIPAQYQSSASGIVLDEYGDLHSVAEHLKDGMGLRMVLERYDVMGVKDHLHRLRFLLDGNAPTVTTLVVAATEVTEETNGEKKSPTTLPELQPKPTTDVVVDGTNLQDFFYLSFGEKYSGIHPEITTDSKTKASKKKKNKNDVSPEVETAGSAGDHTSSFTDSMIRWNELDELTRTNCTVQVSGFHPPPPSRRLVGDLMYLNVTIPANPAPIVLPITATTLGFYVNRCVGTTHFDPSPAAAPHYAHALLDCVLAASPEFSTLWATALAAAQERVALLQRWNAQQPRTSLFRTAIRGDFAGFSSAAVAAQITGEAVDAAIFKASWVVPSLRYYSNHSTNWQRHALHSYKLQRAEEDLQRTFGVELRNGGVRDWNEELQLAREMPTSTLTERLERARLIHKVMTEFGEAALLGVQAIVDGQVAPMNPNEPLRSQVYLLNNIFVSRGIDTGPETFKMAQGDRAARKAANRDLQCIGIFHRMERMELYTLATVLIDYLGTRYVCQSVLPGILIGEKSHTLMYGSVESGVPLKWDEALQASLEAKLGQSLMIGTRPVFRLPLTSERMEEIQKLRKLGPTLETKKVEDNVETAADPDEMISTCVAMESKGIMGSDQRRYMLDLSRLTPLDANWVPHGRGGSGKWEGEKGNGKSHIPSSLQDDEWTMCVLRPELVTQFTQLRMALHMKETNASKEDDPATDDAAEETKDANEVSNGEQPSRNGVDKEYLQSLKMNVNVFLPHVRPLVDEAAAKQLKQDEDLVRQVAEFLWDDILPKITLAIREGSVNPVPVDGKNLTEFLHRNGINCRYLGRLAVLAQEQEEKDAKVESDLKQGKAVVLERRSMPRFWLELLECEMVSRAAKHVLDDYLVANGGIVAAQPAQTVASFLSALVSEVEETAAQTEMRISKRLSEEPDDDDFAALTIVDVGGDGDAVTSPVRSRYEVWQDIEAEIGRRYRYNLIIFNRGNKSHRALYIPLLRRVCQRTGIKLLAKKYNVGGKCFCGGSNTSGGRLTPSYPISPLDIADIVPLMKHVAAYSEGFSPCSFGPTIGLPPLQISLPDARATLERAHIQVSARALGKGLELAQEAGALYQRVTDNAAHPGVVESIDLMATIFFDAGDPVNGAQHVAKSLNLTIQTSGFDSGTALNSHISLFQMLFAAHDMDRAIKHLRAAIYLQELMTGPRHTEHYTSYHKLGAIYSHSDYEGKYLSTALECYREAKKRESSDRLMDGIIAKNIAKVLMGLENFKDALEYEKKSFHNLSIFLGQSHPMTQESAAAIDLLAKLAVEKGNRKEENDKLQAEAAIADSIAADLVAEEARAKKKVEKKKRGKK
jgi:protein TIF31